MGYLKIICAILIWSSLGIFIRKIELPNECIIFYAAMIAGVIQLISLLVSGLLKEERRKNTETRSALFLVLSPLCFVANTMLFYFAFRNTTIANAVLSHYTAPIFVAIMAPLLLKEKIKRATWIAISLSSIGLWFILGGTNPFSNISAGSREGLGIIAGAMSGLAYAFLILTVKRIASVYSSLFITFIQNGITVMILLPFVYNTAVPSQTWPYLLIMGIFHSTIAPVLYVQGFRSAKANEAAILGYFEPVGAIILAFIFLHEVPGIEALLGGALILYSGYMIIRKRLEDGI
jgi:drug/metabolite transporter (DMT)-like permease